MSDASNGKIMGIVPKGRYIYFIYMLMMVGIAGRALGIILAMFSLGFGEIGLLLGLLGVIGLALAVLGLTLYKDEFSDLDRSHFLYAALVYVIGWVAGLFFGSTLAFLYIFALIAVLVILAIEALFIFTGYSSWRGGRTITKDNLRSEIEVALKNR